MLGVGFPTRNPDSFLGGRHPLAHQRPRRRAEVGGIAKGVVGDHRLVAIGVDEAADGIVDPHRLEHADPALVAAVVALLAAVRLVDDGAGIEAEQRADRSARLHGLPAMGTERSEEHTSELKSLMRLSYAVFCWKKNKNKKQ